MLFRKPEIFFPARRPVGRKGKRTMCIRTRRLTRYTVLVLCALYAAWAAFPPPSAAAAKDTIAAPLSWQDTLPT
ncbi:hypothetical protein VU01_12491, partial [Candidatus Electrothrix marina]